MDALRFDQIDVSDFGSIKLTKDQRRALRRLNIDGYTPLKCSPADSQVLIALRFAENTMMNGRKRWPYIRNPLWMNMYCLKLTPRGVAYRMYLRECQSEKRSAVILNVVVAVMSSLITIGLTNYLVIKDYFMAYISRILD